jgi:glycosyltransferase involved in cell wall biosynthesis
MDSPPEPRSNGLKVLILSPFFPSFAPWLFKGGVPSGTPAVYHTLKGLARLGAEVHCMFYDGRGEILQGQEPVQSIDGIHCYFHPLALEPFWNAIRRVSPVRDETTFSLFKFRYASDLLYAAWTASRVAQKIRPDLVYGISYYCVPASWVARRNGVPAISRHLGIFRGYNMELSVVRKWALRCPADCWIICDDGGQGDVVAQGLGVPDEKIRLWRCGVNKDIYRPDFDGEAFKREKGIPLNKKIVMSISRLMPWKRIDRMLDALAKVKDQYRDFLMVIVGEGSEKERLERMSHERDLGPFVRFAGGVPYNEVARYLHIADLFLSTNDFFNIGNNVIEAMICGRCIITLDNGATGEVIANGENGVLIDYQKVHEELPKAIVTLLEDDEGRSKLGRAARQYAMGTYQTWDERIEMEFSLLKDLAGR